MKISEYLNSKTKQWHIGHAGQNNYENLVTLVMFEKSSKREKSTTRKEEFYFSSGSNLIVYCFCGVLLSCILRFPLQKWSFCGQGVSNHS